MKSTFDLNCALASIDWISLLVAIGTLALAVIAAIPLIQASRSRRAWRSAMSAALVEEVTEVVARLQPVIRQLRSGVVGSSAASEFVVEQVRVLSTPILDRLVERLDSFDRSDAQALARFLTRVKSIRNTASVYGDHEFVVRTLANHEGAGNALLKLATDALDLAGFLERRLWSLAEYPLGTFQSAVDAVRKGLQDQSG